MKYPRILLFLLMPLLILSAPLVDCLDLSISQFFYSNGKFSEAFIWKWFYSYGIIPGWLLLITPLILILYQKTLLYPPFLSQKILLKIFLYLILTLGIGSGILIHAIFKDHWGRPRPKQTLTFGGNQPFRSFTSPQVNPPEPSKSFPCGHCSMGFYFFTLISIGYFLDSKKLILTGWGLTLFFGVFLSMARIAQGGHFFSDTLFSGWIMAITAITLAPLLLKPSPDP